MTGNGAKNSGKGPEKQRPDAPEKKILLVAGSALALVLIVIIGITVIMQSPSNAETAPPDTVTTVTQPETENIAQTVHQNGMLTISETPSLPATPAEPVDFILEPGVPTSCGLTCRQLDATLTNTGYMTAHNVCISVSMHNSRDEIIDLNGESTLNRCVGDIHGGQTITEPITLQADCGTFATRCIGETLTLQTWIISDEKTVRFPDQVISV